MALAVTCTADEESPGEVKPGDRSVRENKQHLPSVRRALKKTSVGDPLSVTSCEPQGVNTAETAWLRALRTK